MPDAEASPAIRHPHHGIISSKQKGITVANAFMTDGRVVRFGIVARDPLTVRSLSSEARPGDEEAIEAWFAERGRAP